MKARAAVVDFHSALGRRFCLYCQDDRWIWAAADVPPDMICACFDRGWSTFDRTNSRTGFLRTTVGTEPDFLGFAGHKDAVTSHVLYGSMPESVCSSNEMLVSIYALNCAHDFLPLSLNFPWIVFPPSISNEVMNMETEAGEQGHGEQGHGEQGHGEQGHGEKGHESIPTPPDDPVNEHIVSETGSTQQNHEHFGLQQL